MDDGGIEIGAATERRSDEIELLHLTLAEERRRRVRAEQKLAIHESAGSMAGSPFDPTSLRQSEVRFRTAFESSSIGNVLSELEGKCILVNRAMCDLLGYSESELLALSSLDIIHPDHRAAHIAIRRRLLSGDIDQHESENRYLCKDGRIIWGIGNVALVRDADGFPIKIVGQLQDVTERKSAEDALRESEAHLRAIIDHSPAIIFLRDANGRYLLANSEYEQRNGFVPGSAKGKTVHDLFPRERADYFLSRDRAIHEMGHLTQREGRVSLSNGEAMTTLILRFPVPGPDGRIHAVGAISTNITERKRAEEALKASEARLRAVMDNCPAAVYIRDWNGRFILSNPEFDRRRGMPAGGVVGRCVHDFWPKDQADAILATDRAVLTSRIASASEKNVTFGDGSIHPVLVVRFPIQRDDGEVESIGFISTDITEIRETALKLRQQQAELAHIHRLNILGEMATGLAHELNQPLAAIVSYTQGCVRRLRAGVNNPDELIAAMGKVTDQAKRAGDTVNWMRGFIRKGGEEKSPTDLNILLSEAVDVISHEIGKQGIMLELDLSPEPIVISADRTQIQQVALNLMRNGIEAMHDNPPAQRRLILQSRAHDGVATVTVVDDGPGIQEEHRDRLFDPFFTTKHDGLGMGLSICRTIIEDHGGQLAAEPANGIGTTFHFSLPIMAGVRLPPRQQPSAYSPVK